MRILMIDHWSKDNVYTLELSKELGHLVNLDLLTVDNSSIDEKTNYSYIKKLVGYGHPKTFGLYSRYIKSLFLHFGLATNKKYDCVHVQTYKSPVEILLYLILKPFIKKLIITVHNVLPHEQKKIDYFLYRKIYEISDSLIVHNEQTKMQLLNLFSLDERKIFVVPHGIYNSHLEDSQKSSQPIMKTKHNLLFFGLIRPYKGLDILIEALKILPKDFQRKINVKIVGNNVENINIDELIKRSNINSFVEVVGHFVPENEVKNYFNWADAVVLPYKKISGSGALLLSYTFNKIVITSDLPAFIEETDNGNTGYIFKNEDPLDLSRKIIQFIEADNEEIMHYKENIAKIIDNKYNWINSANLTYEVYRSNRI